MDLYILKWPLIIFLFGFGIRLIGALLKILHYPYADESFTFGTIISVAGILFAIIKLLLLKKRN